LIVSFIDGRLRFRDQALKQPAVMETARALIIAQPGVLSLQANPLTGSILIHYDPAILDRESLLAAADFLEARLADIAPAPCLRPAASSPAGAGLTGPFLACALLSGRARLLAGIFCGLRLLWRKAP
jgi:hypothetical protein